MKYKPCLQKQILFLLINVGCLNIFYSQTSEIDLHKKYWYYKSRFNNDFISIGTDQGQSIPFSQRALNEDYTYSNPNSSVLKAGDATSALGYYIGATEYCLLKINNNA